MRFKNLKTGNYVSTENKETIALMKKSANYVEVDKNGKPKGSTPPANDGGADGGNVEK